MSKRQRRSSPLTQHDRVDQRACLLEAHHCCRRQGLTHRSELYMITGIMAPSLLSSHLEQISLCAASIAELDFPGPKQFTNALLGRHDITALIRDTEIHERALFSIAPPTMSSKGDMNLFSQPQVATGISRQSLAPHAARGPKRNAAVAAVLGRDLYRKVRAADNTANRIQYGDAPRGKGELDVDVLLEGATRLCQVYPVPGAAEEIRRLKARYEQLRANIAHYEEVVARNSLQLDGMGSRGQDLGEMEEGAEEEVVLTRQDLEREEREIGDLERKKRGLESRVSEMEKDLGGLNALRAG